MSNVLSRHVSLIIVIQVRWMFLFFHIITRNCAQNNLILIILCSKAAGGLVLKKREAVAQKKIN